MVRDQRVLQQREVIALGLLLAQQALGGVQAAGEDAGQEGDQAEGEVGGADAHADVQVEPARAARATAAISGHAASASYASAGRDRREERAAAEQQHGGVDDRQAVENGERAVDAAGEQRSRR